mmetsp:Transcript_18151/g.41604  ORF Transcript_18151/g.41604 Transcript_18151/m.41604 type:complete len:390 (-) Transcript_18151:1224-2393(-)
MRCTHPPQRSSTAQPGPQASSPQISCTHPSLPRPHDEPPKVGCASNESEGQRKRSCAPPLRWHSSRCSPAHPSVASCAANSASTKSHFSIHPSLERPLSAINAFRSRTAIACSSSRLKALCVASAPWALVVVLVPPSPSPSPSSASASAGGEMWLTNASTCCRSDFFGPSTFSGDTALRKTPPSSLSAAALSLRCATLTSVSVSTFLQTCRRVDSTSTTLICHAPSRKVARSRPDADASSAFSSRRLTFRLALYIFTMDLTILMWVLHTCPLFRKYSPPASSEFLLRCCVAREMYTLPMVCSRISPKGVVASSSARRFMSASKLSLDASRYGLSSSASRVAQSTSRLRCLCASRFIETSSSALSMPLISAASCSSPTNCSNCSEPNTSM